jgi:hypothetical protein
MKRITLKFAIALLTFIIGISAASLWIIYREPSDSLHHINAVADSPILFCDLIQNARQYNSKTIRVRAFLVGRHAIWLYDPRCSNEILVEFDPISRRKLFDALDAIVDPAGIRGFFRADVILGGRLEEIPKAECWSNYCYRFAVSDVEQVKAVTPDVDWPE